MADETVKAELVLAAERTLGRQVGRTPGLTPQVHQLIVARTQAGAFAHVAASAAGVPSSTFHRWLQKGAEDWLEHERNVEAGITSEPTIYAALWYDVMQARGKARAVAETRVYKEKPELWLTKGPGRDRPGEPGWTDRTEVTGPGGGPLQVLAGTFDLKKLSDAELEALESLTIKATGSSADQG